MSVQWLVSSLFPVIVNAYNIPGTVSPNLADSTSSLNVFGLRNKRLMKRKAVASSNDGGYGVLPSDAHMGLSICLTGHYCDGGCCPATFYCGGDGWCYESCDAGCLASRNLPAIGVSIAVFVILVMACLAYRHRRRTTRPVQDSSPQMEHTPAASTGPSHGITPTTNHPMTEIISQPLASDSHTSGAAQKSPLNAPNLGARLPNSSIGTSGENLPPPRGYDV